jgi:adenine-specific DNA-methyltransferase
MADNSLKKGRYTKFSNKIGLYSNSGHGFINQGSDVVLNFPYKDAVLEGGMSKEDVGRDERFLHFELDRGDIDTLEDPKVLTNFKAVNAKDEHQLTAEDDVRFFDDNDDLAQNLLIKGNNLLALYTLRPKLTNKVKLIYIDPPYNTGSDGFKYNDRFNHSAWLTFMKNRLEIAHDLLSDDGLIFVQCDDNEQAYLKVLMDEIFNTDQNNFVNTIAVRMSTASGMKTSHRTKTIVKIKEFLLVYAKNKQNIELNPVYVRKDHFDDEYGFFVEKHDSSDPAKWIIKRLDEKLDELGISKVKDINDAAFKKFYLKYADCIWARGRHHSIPKDIFEQSLKNRDTVFGYGVEGTMNYAYRGRRLAFLSKTLKTCFDEEGNIVRDIATLSADIWNEVNTAKLFAEGGVELANGKKPEYLIQKVITLATNPGDIVLDYHLGSGTTAAVAHKMGRRWIGVEQMDYIETLAKTRLIEVLKGEQGGVSKSLGWHGGGNFIYMELKKYNQDFVDQIVTADSLSSLDIVYNEMARNAFLKFWFDKREFEKDENYRSLTLEDRKQKLIEILDENQLYLNYPDMKDASHKVSADDQVLTDRFYA